MSAWQTVLLVMRREFAARKKAYTITTAILVTIAVAVIVVVGIVTEGSTTRITGDDADQGLGFAAVVIMFLGIIFTGQVIMEGVAEEKRSRVVEVVLGTMLPRHLLAGKVTAIGLMGFTEILVLVAGVVTAAEVVDVFALPRGTLLGLLSMLVWFALGFALYSALYAAGGAMVAPHENVQNGAVPINLGLAIPYMVSVTTAPAGDNMLLKVMSIFPLSAPLVMPLRSIAGYAAGWEIALSLALTVVAVYLLIRFAGRLYTGAIMRGGKVKWREAWRTAGHMG